MQRTKLVTTLRELHPTEGFYDSIMTPAPRQQLVYPEIIRVRDAMICGGRTISASSPNHIAKTKVLVDGGTIESVGEIRQIFLHHHYHNGQPNERLFVEMQWYTQPDDVLFWQRPFQLWDD